LHMAHVRGRHGHGVGHVLLSTVCRWSRGASLVAVSDAAPVAPRAHHAIHRGRSWNAEQGWTRDRAAVGAILLTHKDVQRGGREPLAGSSRIAPSEVLMPVRRLTRSNTQGKIAGVCAGMADYFEVDVVLVRVSLGVLALLGAVIGGVIAYLAAWILIPVRTEPDPVPSERRLTLSETD